MVHILRILGVFVLLGAATSARADPAPIEQPSEQSEGISPARGADPARLPRRGVRKERRPVERPTESDGDVAPAPAPASMPTDLSAPPHLPDDHETSLV